MIAWKNRAAGRMITRSRNPPRAKAARLNGSQGSPGVWTCAGRDGGSAHATGAAPIATAPSIAAKAGPRMGSFSLVSPKPYWRNRAPRN